MKKLVFSLIAAVLVFIGSLIGIKTLCFPSSGQPSQGVEQHENENADPQVDPTKQITESVEVVVDPAEDNPIKLYDNGIASFSYDSTMVEFYEMMSGEEDGYPITTFMLKTTDENDVLPRLDIVPLTVVEPFTDATEKEEWEDMVKALLLAYYSTEEQSLVQVDISDAVVKVNGPEAKMYTRFTTTLDGSATPNLSGNARLVANQEYAVITLSLANKGESIPWAFEDVYMSAELH